jgi:hypothetical protein
LAATVALLWACLWLVRLLDDLAAGPPWLAGGWESLTETERAVSLLVAGG